jgi:hypothetical protein
MNLIEFLKHGLMWRFVLVYCIGMTNAQINHIGAEAVLCITVGFMVVKAIDKYGKENEEV